MDFQNLFDKKNCDIAWCPGCGNFDILNLVKEVLAELEYTPQQTVIVSGIGQAAKIPQYLNVNFFNGLHGRALPPATAIKAVFPELKVIAESGDGDTYGDGGNHFLHCIRRNPDITNIVHNNMVYGLTKGQASPTSAIGFHTPVQTNGVLSEPFNPLSVAIALDVSFAARVFTGEKEHAKEVLKKALTHKGYALVDFLQPCVVFNKINTYKWFKDHTYILDSAHDASDRIKAFEKAVQKDKLPLGIFYVNEKKAVFEENQPVYKENKKPLYQRNRDYDQLQNLIESFRY